MKPSARKGRARVAGASGQALVPALIFLLIGCIGLYVAFNSFQMTSAKIKLQNTADAAAYSAAVMQARDYNFSAYTNRAMVANQVTAAQAVALKSWIDDLDSTYGSSQADDLVVNAIADHPSRWTAPKALGKIDIAPVRATLDALTPSVATGIGSIVRALSTAQANYHAATLTAVPDAANAIAQQNQADTHVTAGYFTSQRNAVQLGAWKSYTETVRPAGITGPDDFADVVTDTRTLDNFIKNRGATRSVAPNYQQLDDSAVKICGANSRITVNVTHDGGTQLRSDKSGWQSIDASTARVTISCMGALLSEAGYGGSANGNITSFMTHPPFAAWQDWEGYGGYFNFGYTGSTTPGWQVPDAMADQFRRTPGPSLDPVNGGLLPYQNTTGAPVAGTAPRITIEVERLDDTLVKTQALKGGGDMAVDFNGAGQAMRALSSANAYFVRPDETALGSLRGALLHANQWARDDGKAEYPSLFSPYWQARLAPVSASERNAAIAAQVSQGTQVMKP
ncbi:pilus assembly protein TadG-related protein [Paraburkholderia sp.]|uniref:pilus assembly protein TadG-related protein n=1 Tax=Paraburkholderia sp. TaxID=1926495 RepID=UPI0023A1C6E6|nr:pilus assembly protein TadG-related protein [Paraburkholderia sp.]MDE1182033.1 pilus assembly protein TadG-related protein [Paraburkholderia sp.]